MSIYQRKRKTFLKIVLQGNAEPFFTYEHRLQKLVDKISTQYKSVESGPVVLPSADSNGRMCCIIQWRALPLKKKPKRKRKK